MNEEDVIIVVDEDTKKDESIIKEVPESDYAPELEVPETAEKPDTESGFETGEAPLRSETPTDGTVGDGKGRKVRIDEISDRPVHDTKFSFSPVISDEDREKIFSHFLSIVENPEKQYRKNVRIDADLVQTINECSFTGMDYTTVINAALRCFLLNVLENLSLMRKSSRVDSLFAKYIRS